ncbi:MAG: hypothetical protein R2932_33805 [Caldilineaceae bacterium]
MPGPPEPTHAAPVTLDGRQIFPHTAGDNPTAETYAVIEHEDFRARLLLPELFPSATITHEIVDSNGAIYARLYERPRIHPPCANRNADPAKRPGAALARRHWPAWL